MAGHSKWKNIQFRKERQDKLKTKLFTRFARDIANLVRKNSNLETNNDLKNLLRLAQINCVPKDILDRAIAKNKDKEGEVIIYEGFVGNNIALMIRVITDNKIRTAPEIRALFKRLNGNMGTCSYLFEFYGVIEYLEANLMEIMDIVSDLIIDIRDNYLFVKQEHLMYAVNKLLDAKIQIPYYNFEYVAIDSIEIDTQAPIGPKGENIGKIIDLFEELNDVDEVFSNIL